MTVMPFRSAQRPLRRIALACAALAIVGACGRPLDWDMRGVIPTNLDTSEAARQPTASRPQPDGRGVISYPTYQVAVARRGDTVGSIAQRVGIPASELASYNALASETGLREGEVLALPRRVSEPMTVTADSGFSSDTSSISSGSIAAAPVDVTTLASGAIERAETSGTVRRTPATSQSASSANVSSRPPAASGSRAEPVRHQVKRGETAYSIARLYNVSARSLAEWNGLDAQMTVRDGQYLLIPVATGPAPAQSAANQPGTGSPTPPPPSAATPLPEKNTKTNEEIAAATPASPNLGAQRTPASSARLAMPVEGSIIRPYARGKNEGIDIAAPAGATVHAATDGTVAAITQDTDQVPILVIRHANNLLTVYANIDSIKVAKGSAVTRGQAIATVRQGNPSFLHFEVRNGYESVDPMSYLQ
ncbi:peptidase M23B [Haematobacter missouriensis]|uniref:Peptidase M23 n=1 Tax=Haematobacter missouriensis TaxID=366616 RepID=A0A212AK62_9RHOB|nr:peptidase M23B [Haematobacter missouriensis]OWJ77496.1 peptidase M23 [Haematobacter missouriensis]OWJ81806.1 peptidase M23 [Haematobacter missouriensis]